MSLSQEILAAAVPDGYLSLWWLGMSGFAFKTSRNQILLVDPYLSDFVPDPPGWVRVDPSPLLLSEAYADFLLFTHDDFDHLDPLAVPALARRLSDLQFVGPPACCRMLRDWGIEEQRLHCLDLGQTIRAGGLQIDAAFAIHTPGCVGLVVDFASGRVHAVGDTLWDERLLGAPRGLDLMLVPITPPGSDNLTMVEAAQLAAGLAPRTVIPCHYGTFEVFHSDPAAFLNLLQAHQVGSQVVVLKPGQRFDLRVAAGPDMDA